MHKAAVRELFDALALEYVRDRDAQASFIAQKKVVLEMLAGSSGRLLDAGCGPGVMEADLLQRGFDVTGIDLSLEMLRHGVRRLERHPLAERCRMEPGDIERLRFADGSFDAVVCMGVLEYLRGYARALGELRRVLREGGLAVLSVPNRLAPYHLAMGAYRLAKKLAGLPRTPFVPNRCVPWLLLAQLEREGLRPVESCYCGNQYIVAAVRTERP